MRPQTMFDPIGSVTGHSKINSGGSPETSMALAFRRNNFSFSHSLMRAQSITDLISAQILKGDFTNRNFSSDKDPTPNTGLT